MGATGSASSVSTQNAISASHEAVAVLTMSPLKGVNIQDPRLADLTEQRSLARTLMGGTKAMRDAAEKFTPKHPAESADSYKARLDSSVLFGAFADAIQKQTGKMFVEPVQLDDSVSERIKTFCENVDGEGTALTPFAFDLAKEGMCDGVSFILIDSPTLPANATVADEQQLGAQPYWVLVRADDVLSVRSEFMLGKRRLTQFRYREIVQEPDGDFTSKRVERVRVIEPGRFRVYEQRKTADGRMVWQLIQDGTTSWSDVKVVPFYANRVGYMEGSPPFQCLAELNLEHWISCTENRHALTFLRFAMLCITGATAKIDEVEIGPDKLIKLSNPAARAGYVEHSGAGIDSGFKDLERIEKSMASAGVQLTVENAGQVTATSAAIDSAEMNAGLRAVAKALEDALESALAHTAEIMREAPPDVTVYDDFAEEPPPGEEDFLLKMRVANEMSQETLWDELKRRHILDEDFDPDEEKKRLDSETPPTLKLGPPAQFQPGQPPQPSGQPQPPMMQTEE